MIQEAGNSPTGGQRRRFDTWPTEQPMDCQALRGPDAAANQPSRRPTFPVAGAVVGLAGKGIYGRR